MEQLFYWRIGRPEIAASLSGSPFAWPILKQSEVVKIGLRPTMLMGQDFIEVDREILSIKASIGRVDKRPDSGSVSFGILNSGRVMTAASATTFTLTGHLFTGNERVRLSASGALPVAFRQNRTYFVVVTDADTVGFAKSPGGAAISYTGGTGTFKCEQITAPLSYNSSAGDLASAINSLVIVEPTYGECEVEEDNNSFLVVFPDYEEKVNLRAYDCKLKPISFVRIRAVELEGYWEHEVRYVQSPVAIATNPVDRLPTPPVISEFQPGSTSESGNLTPAIQRIQFNPDFRALYQIERNGVLTDLLDRSDGPAQVAEAIKPLADSTGFFEVTNPTTGIGHIKFLGSMSGEPQDLMTIVVPGDPPPPDKWLALDLGGRVASAILRESVPNAAGFIELTLEIEVRYKDPDDAGKVVTWNYEQKVQFKPELIYESLEEVAEIPWMRRNTASSYKPFSEASTTVGHAGVSHVFGAYEEEEMTHDLDTFALQVQVYENSTDGKLLVPGRDYDLVLNTTNYLTVTLLGDYAGEGLPGEGGLVANILGMADTSALDPHGHEIEEIEELRTELNELWAWIQHFRNLIGGNAFVDTRETQGAKLVAWTFPTLWDLYPTLGRKPSTVPASLFDLLAPDYKLPSVGALLPAVHDATVEEMGASYPDWVSNGTPTSSLSSAKGKVVRNDTSFPILLPGGGGRKSVTIANNEYVGCDGNYFYRVTPYERGLPTKNFTVDYATVPEVLATAGGNVFVNGNLVRAVSSTTLPSPLAANTDYYIRNRTDEGVSLSATPTGSIITLTNNGTGIHTLVPQSRISYYPTDFERDLFEFEVNPSQLTLASQIESQVGIELAVFYPKSKTRERTSRYHCVLAIQFGSYPTTSGTSGESITNPVWSPNPAIQIPVVITNVPTVHTIGFAVSRKLVGGVDTLTAWGIAYGNKIECQGPTSPRFAVRGRIIKGDTEDGVLIPRGMLGMIGPKQVGPGVTPPSILGGAKIS